MKRVRVNVRTAVNSAAIRRETRHGREKIIVPSATLPDDVVMNDIAYPADEIAASYKTLEGTPAPLGHPTLGGAFIAASSTEAMVRNGIGAVNENVVRANGRVFMDKVIDVEFAGRSEGGKAVLNAIEKGEPIHTSTGLLCELENAAESAGHRYTARNIFFDHDAILIDEMGAATPEQGVGMLVNKALTPEGKEIEVVNSALEDAERELDWAADMAVRAAERMARVPLMERIKSAIMEAVKGPERETSTNRKEDDMAVSEEQFNALSDEVKTLSESMGKIGETIAEAVQNAVKPLTDNLVEMQANQKAKDDAELAGHVAAIVKANILDEDSAKELTLNAARKLAEKAKPKGAAALNAAFTGNADDDEFAGFDLNKSLEGAK